jgi:dolichol kinase
MVKLKEQIKKTREKINQVNFDVHWYRRVFHSFGAVFLIYYVLPDVKWVNLLKTIIPIIILSVATIIEILRVKGKISSSHFFGLRFYEKKRIGSYLFFGFAIVILLLFFPQQIAIPCILCGCFADPIIGELRRKVDKKMFYISGFLVCMLFFVVTWYSSDFIVLISISLIGGGSAFFGESKKFRWIDDDFMIQILPAIIICLMWLSLKFYGIDILPDQIIYAGGIPW